MKVEALPVVQGDHNLGNYEEMYKQFRLERNRKRIYME